MVGSVEVSGLGRRSKWRRTGCSYLKEGLPQIPGEATAQDTGEKQAGSHKVSQPWGAYLEEGAAEPEQQVPNFSVYLEHQWHLLKKSDSVSLWQGPRIWI